MKKIFLLAILPLLLCACSGDDDEPVMKNKIVGEWIETAYLCSDGYFVHVSHNNETYLFNADMTYSNYDGYSFTEKGTYTADTGATIIDLTSKEGHKATIIVEYDDKDHATFTTRTGRTSKFERK